MWASSTNIEFLKKLCRSKAFIEGDVETGFIDKWKNELFGPREVGDEVFAQAALGLLGSQLYTGTSGPHGQTLGFGEASTQAERKFALRIRDDAAEAEPETRGSGNHSAGRLLVQHHRFSPGQERDPAGLQQYCLLDGHSIFDKEHAEDILPARSNRLDADPGSRSPGKAGRSSNKEPRRS